MQPYFRDAVPGDLSAIAVVLRQAGDEANASDRPLGSYRDALSEIDRALGNYVLVAEYDGEIGAVLQMITFRHLQNRGGRTAQIISLHVADRFKTSGIDGMLLDHAVERARDLDCHRLQVLSSTARTDEHSFWERHGYVQLDRGYVRPLDDR